MSISASGIAQAIAGLNYRNPSAVKCRVLDAIRQYYDGLESPEMVGEIATDDLVRRIWGLEEPTAAAIQSKRKNLSSIKSTLNADLDRAWREGRNPEGIMIGPDNTFTMSNEAKDKMIAAFSDAVSADGAFKMDEVNAALKLVSEFLSSRKDTEMAEGLEKLTEIVKKITEETGRGDVSGYDWVKKGEKGPSEGEGNGEQTTGAGAARKMPGDSVSGEGAEPVTDVSPEAPGLAMDDMAPDEMPERQQAGDIEEYEEIEVIEEDEIMEETEEIEGAEEEAITELVDEDAEIVEEAPEGLPEEEALPEEGALELVEAFEEGAGPDGIEASTGTDEFPELEAVEDLEYIDDIEEIEDMEEMDLPEEEDAVIEETEEIEVAEEDAITDLIDEDAEIVEEAPEGLPEQEALPDEEALELVEEIEEGAVIEETEEIEVAEDDVMEEFLDADADLPAEALSDEDIEFVDEEVWDEKVELDPEIGADDGIDGVEEMVKQLLAPELTGVSGGKNSLKTDNWMQNVGLPVDMFDEEGVDLEHLEKDTEKKKVLAARFDGYLGVMERYYNQFITIPEGDYLVGGRGDPQDELPLRKVSLPVYYFGKFPVTNAVFEIFVDRTGYVTTAERRGYGVVYVGRFRKIVDDKTGRSRSVWNPTSTRKKVEGASWFQPLGPGSSLHNKRNHPVVQVSLKDAKSFAAWTGKRLPTEIEWEAAARTKDGRGWPWGDEWQETLCNAESSGISDTTAVNQYPGGDNPFGVSDLMGNVMEWTNDLCEPRYETERKSVFYVAKGGGWIADHQVTLSSRNRIQADFSSNILGFRCVVE